MTPSATSAGPRIPFLLSLASIAFVGPLAIHLFLPVMPEIRKAFGIPVAEIGITFTVTLLVMAFSTFFYGPLSDRYGRRPVLLCGLALFIAGGALCAIANSTTALLLGRVVQAFGAGAAASLNRAIALDAYGSERLVKVLAYLTMAYTLGPMIAPFVGGLLIDTFGWRAVFWFATLSGAAIALGAWRALYETHPPRAAGEAARPGFIASYAHMLKQPRFCAFILQSGFSTATFMAMGAAATFLMQDYLGRSASEFGRYFVMLPIGFLCGNIVSSRLSGRVRIETMVLTGCIVMAIALGTQAVIVLAGYLNPLIIFVPGFLLTFSQGLALPNAQTGALRMAGKSAGAAAGLGVFCQMFFGALGAQLFTTLADGTPTPMVITVLLGTALTFASGLYAFVTRPRT